MAFAELANFISRDMRMSHIYQPVMLLELLQHQVVGTRVVSRKRYWSMMKARSSTTPRSRTRWSVKFFAIEASWRRKARTTF